MMPEAVTLALLLGLLLRLIVCWADKHSNPNHDPNRECEICRTNAMYP